MFSAFRHFLMKSKMDRNYAAESEDALLDSESILDFIEDKESGFYSLSQVAKSL